MRLAEFKGNSRLVGLLRNRQLPPVSLFSGPEGVGKKTLALLLAGLSNCRLQPRDDLCDTCSSCLKLSQGFHPDIRLITPEKTSLKVEQIRQELVEEARFRPFESVLRFFIIDRAETMTPEAANALLKTLEEPPETTRIVMITAFPEQLLATVRSRCQRFQFNPLSRSQILEILRARLPEEMLEMTASFASGSVGRAFGLDLEDLLRSRDLMLELLESWLKGPCFTIVFEFCERPPLRQELKNRERIRQYFDQLELLLIDLYFLQVESSDRLVSRDRFPQLEQLAGVIDLDWLTRFLYYVREARRDLDHFVSPQMCFETLWLRP